jgi:hypothetical protein
VIGDAGAVDLRRLRDLARRGRVEAVAAEQVEPGPDQRLPRALGVLEDGCACHGEIIARIVIISINRLIE